VVQSVPAYSFVSAVPGPVDMAVIAVPGVHVVEVARERTARECGRSSSSPPDSRGDRSGWRSPRALLLGVCRDAGMRLVGPNCLGVINTEPEVQLNATFAPTFPAPGRVGSCGRAARSAWLSSTPPRRADLASFRLCRSATRRTSPATGALVAASDLKVDALFRQSGAIRTDTLGELLDVASLLASQPTPAGGRMAVVRRAMAGHVSRL
jgi:acetate---CoA ligase (ADP-forming)